MATYKIEPISGDDYRLEVNNCVSTLTAKIRLRDIPRVVQGLGVMGYKAEKIEWHCCES